MALGLLGAAVLTVAARLAGISLWAELALAWLLVSMLGAFALAFVRGPDTWVFARAADALGLSERITSALYAQRQASTVAQLLGADAEQALARLDPARYGIAEQGRVWRPVLVGIGLLAVLLVAPIPQLGNDPGHAADATRVAAAQQRVAALEVQAPTDARRTTPLGQASAAELRALRDALARTDNSADAARTIEEAQRHLAQLPGNDDYAWRRALDSVAAALEAQNEQALLPLSRALRDRDEQALQQALAELGTRLNQPGALTDAERARLQVALQAAANAAAQSQPRLAGALRRHRLGAAQRRITRFARRRRR